MTKVQYQDTWPETPRLLWQLRHESAGRFGRFAITQRACVSCGHFFSPGHFRDHLRSAAHRAQRGWWRR